MQIAHDSVAAIHYTLTLGDGTVADNSESGEPLAYLHGYGNIVPGLERQLDGRKAGDEFEVTVPAAEGYGEFEADAEQTIPRTGFPADVDLRPGMMFHTEDDEGNVESLWIKQVAGEAVLITGNHPLAGQTLHFQVKVVEVRKATKEELAHGHVHGPGGHHH